MFALPTSVVAADPLSLLFLGDSTMQTSPMGGWWGWAEFAVSGIPSRGLSSPLTKAFGGDVGCLRNHCSDALRNYAMGGTLGCCFMCTNYANFSTYQLPCCDESGHSCRANGNWHRVMDDLLRGAADFALVQFGQNDAWSSERKAAIPKVVVNYVAGLTAMTQQIRSARPSKTEPTLISMVPTPAAILPNEYICSGHQDRTAFLFVRAQYHLAVTEGLPWVNLWGAVANWYTGNIERDAIRGHSEHASRSRIENAMGGVHTRICGSIVIGYIAMLLLSNGEVAGRSKYQRGPMGHGISASKLGKVLSARKAEIAAAYRQALALGCAQSGGLDEEYWPKLCSEDTAGKGIGIMRCNATQNQTWLGAEQERLGTSDLFV